MPQIELPGIPRMGPQPTVIASPINDVQLVAVIAAMLLPNTVKPIGSRDTSDVPLGEVDVGPALELAFNLVGWAIVRYNAGRLQHYARSHEAALRADKGPDA